MPLSGHNPSKISNLLRQLQKCSREWLYKIEEQASYMHKVSLKLERDPLKLAIRLVIDGFSLFSIYDQLIHGIMPQDD